jgi:hypothetical protein
MKLSKEERIKRAKERADLVVSEVQEGYKHYQITTKEKLSEKKFKLILYPKDIPKQIIKL